MSHELHESCTTQACAGLPDALNYLTQNPQKTQTDAV